MSHWLWVFGEIAALRAVLAEQRMAFPLHARDSVAAMRPGDQAVLYVTRGAHHNPTRDEARLAGLVEVREAPQELQTVVAERSFPFACRIAPILVLPERSGPPVKPLAEQLAMVRKPAAWGSYFRRSPLQLTEPDFRVLRSAMDTWTHTEGASS
jgi:hypothetical protein